MKMGGGSWQEKLDEAKKRHRPRLKNWQRDGFATHRAKDFEALATLDASNRGGHRTDTISRGHVERRSCQFLSLLEFVECYEKESKPLVITGIPEKEGWPAVDHWSPSALKRSSRLKRYTFKCGEEDDGRSVRVRLKHFFKYMREQRDDSPLYIFDSTYDDDKEASKLLDDYRVPSYFPDDFFSLVGEKRRPPYRWFLVGPKRSGTSLHIDPLGTSAWNTVLKGRKRWVLFPPGTPKDIAKGKSLYRSGEDDEPINYFVDIIPRMRQRYGKEITLYEIIQEEGETVFVPGGWWHAVINLEDSIAVTQNFVSRINFATVWRKTRTGRKKMGRRWLALLEEKYPDLGALAHKLNGMDEFVMPTDEERRERRRLKKERKEKEKQKGEKRRKAQQKEEEKRKAGGGEESRSRQDFDDGVTSKKQKTDG